MQQTYDIVVPKNLSECAFCLEIIKTIDPAARSDEFEYDHDFFHDEEYLYRHDYYYKTFDFALGRPRLEANVYRPHVCCLSTLVRIQKYYSNGWITDELFDQWMAVNGGDYQLGRSGRIDWLWSERRQFLKPDTVMVKDCDSPDIIAALTHSPIIVFKCPRHRNANHVKLRPCKPDRSKLKVLNLLFPFSSEADRKKTNLDLASLVTGALEANNLDAVNRAFTIVPVGSYNCVASAMLIHSLGNKHHGIIFNLIIKDKACCLQPKMFNKYLKTITTALRRTSRLPDGTTAQLEVVAMCAYWEQCLGRSGMLSDWAQEKENRTSIALNLAKPLSGVKDVDTNAEYLSDFSRELDDILTELIVGKPKYDSFEEFCKNRQSWLSSGSSGGEYLMVDGDGVRINKRTYFEGVSIEEMTAWLDEEPRMEAVASEKFEQSKARAIYGTKPKDYAIMAYAMMQAEANLYRVNGLEGGLVGADEVRSILRRVKLFRDDAKLEGLMLDYADFNIQHTLEVQAIVFERMSARLVYLGVTGDMIKALAWCAASLRNQWVKFPGESVAVKTVQGLFSGNRGTNFINTLCNLTYFKVASSYVAANLKLRPVGLYNLHQGDDVWFAFKNRIWGVALYMVMKNTGFVFQKEKQLQDRGRGEFLRVLYSNEGAMGYVARSIGTFLIRPLQGEDDTSPDSRCTALNSQIMILRRRGLSQECTDIIWQKTILHGAKSSLKSGDTFLIPKKVLTRNYLDGGLDLGPPGTMCARGEKVMPIPTIQCDSPDIYKAVPRHTTNAWIEVISKRFKGEIDVESLSDMLHKINTSDSLRPIDRQRALSLLHKQLRLWAAKLVDVRPVRRDYLLYSDWLQSAIKVDGVLSAAVERQQSLIPVKRDLNVPRTRIETIISAISSSPFRDIASAERALHLGKIGSARAAIKCCKNLDLSQQALSVMRDIETRTSVAVLSRVISGVRGVGSTFECDIHPIILSWMNRLCLDCALNVALWHNITKIDDWDELLFSWQNMGIKALFNNKDFIEMSHY